MIQLRQVIQAKRCRYCPHNWATFDQQVQHLPRLVECLSAQVDRLQVAQHLKQDLAIVEIS